MKKQLLSLGALATVAAPVVAVVSCGKVDPEVAKIQDEYKANKAQSDLAAFVTADDAYKEGKTILWAKLNADLGIGEEPKFREGVIAAYNIKKISAAGRITISALVVDTKVKDENKQKLGTKEFEIAPK